MAKRSIFDELMEAVAAMRAHRERKLTLRTCKVEPKTINDVRPVPRSTGRQRS